VAVAFLAGVPVLAKPATATALLSHAMVEDVVKAGVLPEGALSLVCGSAGDMLDHLDGQAVRGNGSSSTSGDSEFDQGGDRLRIPDIRSQKRDAMIDRSGEEPQLDIGTAEESDSFNECRSGDGVLIPVDHCVSDASSLGGLQERRLSTVLLGNFRRGFNSCMRGRFPDGSGGKTETSGDRADGSRPVIVSVG
jgi:hypothetical protein